MAKMIHSVAFVISVILLGFSVAAPFGKAFMRNFLYNNCSFPSFTEVTKLDMAFQNIPCQNEDLSSWCNLLTTGQNKACHMQMDPNKYDEVKESYSEDKLCRLLNEGQHVNCSVLCHGKLVICKYLYLYYHVISTDRKTEAKPEAGSIQVDSTKPSGRENNTAGLENTIVDGGHKTEAGTAGGSAGVITSAGTAGGSAGVNTSAGTAGGSAGVNTSAGTAGGSAGVNTSVTGGSNSGGDSNITVPITDGKSATIGTEGTGETILTGVGETKPSKTSVVETKPSETGGVETKPSETGGVETKPSETVGVETKPSETGGVETKSSETGGVETKPSETGGVETKPSETGGMETKPSETSGVETKPSWTSGVETKPSWTSGVETKPSETGSEGNTGGKTAENTNTGVEIGTNMNIVGTTGSSINIGSDVGMNSNVGAPLNTDNQPLNNQNSVNKSPVANNQVVDDEDEPSSGHFVAYFLTAVVLYVAGYVLFHNKQKIVAFIIEGRSGRRQRRPKTSDYRKLQPSVEEVMPSLEKSTTGSKYIY